MKKLEELEKEEEERDKAHYYSMSESEEDEDTKEMRKTAKVIREKRLIRQKETREKKWTGDNQPRMPRPVKRSRSQADLEREMEELGVEVWQPVYIINTWITWMYP